jgi:hypothetical protein
MFDNFIAFPPKEIFYRHVMTHLANSRELVFPDRVHFPSRPDTMQKIAKLGKRLED